MKEKANIIRPVLVGVLVYAVIYLIFHPYIVTGSSMEPTYNNGDVVICTTFFSEENLQRGDVVVITQGVKKIIKRLVALPGDRVEIRDGMLYVNDELSPYNYEAMEDPGMLINPVTLIEDEYIYLGDNRNASSDSRDYGMASISDIKCLVTRTIYKSK